MAGKVESSDEKEILKLVETVKEKTERIEQLLEEKEQLERTLNAKDVMNKTLQNALLAKEKLNRFLKEKMKEYEKSGMDNDKDKEMGDAEKGDENVRKSIRRENDQEINQPQDANANANRNPADFVPVEAAIKVVGIPMILQNLLKCIKNRDLIQNCRLVSREWRDLATSILLGRKTFQLYFRRYESSEKFRVRCSKLYGTSDLTQLTTFFQTSKTFPCAHFVFDGNLKSDDAQEFLTKFGSRVKGVKLIGPQNLYLVRKLLVEQIPQVESLQLKGFAAEGNVNPGPNIRALFPPDARAPAPQIPIRVPIPVPVQTRIFPENSPAPPPAPQLSSLTSIKLGKGNSPELIQEILTAAPNLQECFGIRSREEIESLRQSHRLHIVKGLKLKPEKVAGLSRVVTVLDLMQILLENSPADPLYKQLHLTDLQVSYSTFLYPLFDPQTRSHFCSLISKLLAASQTTLKQLKFTPDWSFEGLIEWSTLKLEKVEKLSLEGDLIRDFVRIFPPLEISQIFPNLQTLQLKELLERMTEEQVRILKNIPRILTVKNLFLVGAHVEMIKGFARLLPNVTHLSIKTPHWPFYSEPFSKWAPIIWHMMRGLKSLQLEFYCSAAEIDAGFTGMESETCKLIRTLGGNEFQMEEIHNFRTSPSILNLTELEALFLPGGFTEDENPKYDKERGANSGGRHDAEFNKASFISFKYAFKLMTKLRVFPGADF